MDNLLVNLNLCRHVNRVANAKEDDLEALYEKRLRRKTLENEEKKGIEVDRVDALPIKTLDGQLYYKTGLQFTVSPFLILRTFYLFLGAFCNILCSVF